MHNKILTILIIGSLIFTIAYLPPSVKAFTNTIARLNTGNTCYNVCANPQIITGSEVTLNDLLIAISLCVSGNNPITSITDNSSPAQAWTLDKSASLNTGSVSVELPTNPGVFGATTYRIEIWHTRVTQVFSATININYASTNSGCFTNVYEANVNTAIFNNFVIASFNMPTPVTNVPVQYTATISPSGAAVTNYLAVFASLYDFTSQINLNVYPNSCSTLCNNAIVGNSALEGGIIFNTSPNGNSGGVFGDGYIFSSTGASNTIGTQVISQTGNANAPLLTLGVLFSTSGSVANCNALVCNISEAIPFNEGLNQLASLVVTFSEFFHFREFLNVAQQITQRITESFTFLEQIPLVGPIFAQQIKDSFRLLDSLCIITFSCSFVTFTQPTPRTYVLTDNPIDYFVTIFMIPAIAIIGIIFLMRKGAEIPEHMVMPLILFAVLMIAWGGANTIFPASVSLLVILIAGAALSYYIADWFYGRLNRTGAVDTE